MILVERQYVMQSLRIPSCILLCSFYTTLFLDILKQSKGMLREGKGKAGKQLGEIATIRNLK